MVFCASPCAVVAVLASLRGALPALPMAALHEQQPAPERMATVAEFRAGGE